MLTITGAGDITVRASQAGNDTYLAADPVQQTLTVNKAPQAITFNPVTKSYGDAPFGLSATGGGSGNPVTFTLVSGPGTLSGANNALLTITGAGDITVLASQAGNGNYFAAVPVQRTVTVNKASQAITFNPVTKSYGDAPFGLSATGGGSGNPVTFTLVSGPGTLSGTNNALLTITGAGDITVLASQAGNGNYLAAVPVQQIVKVNKASQTITFNPVSKSYGDVPFSLSATGGGSGNPVTFTLVSGSGTLSGTNNALLTITGAGDITVRASQAGNGNYLAADPVQQIVKVNKANQNLTFSQPIPVVFGSGVVNLTPYVTAGASTGPVTFSIMGGTGSGTLAGATLTITHAGTIILQADQVGDGNYNAAVAVQRALTVSKANQSLTFGQPIPVIYGSGVVFLAPYVTAGASTSPVTFSIIGGTGSGTLAGATLTINGAGTIILQADQAADGNYNAAVAVQRTLTVNKASQTITFNPVTKRYGDVPFDLGALATGGGSENPLTFTLVSGPGTLSGTNNAMLTLTGAGAGEIKVRASQAGNANYVAAADVQQTIKVVDVGTIVTGVSPSHTPIGIMAQVVITGANFTGATAVKFGMINASFVVNSDTRITAKAPLGHVGTVDITVTTVAGTSITTMADKFSFDETLSAGGSHTCGVKPDGSVACWGYNVAGQAPATEAGPFTQVSAGGNHTCGVKPDGSVACWGHNYYGQAPATEAGPFTQVNAGDFYSCGLKPDGSVAFWGDNNYGQAPATEAGPFTQVSAGGNHTCGVKPDGSVACWGHNVAGQAPSSVTGTFIQVSAGGDHTCGVKLDGSVACWGDNYYGPAPATKAGPFTQVSTGYFHTCGLKPDGSVTCWGYNGKGQAPATVAGPFTQVSAGASHTCGVKPDGGIACWGDNSSGQAPVVSITQKTLVNGMPGVSYTQSVTASGGVSPYRFKLLAGTLPPGLSLAEDGALKGTPTVVGAYSFAIEAVDSSPISFSGTRDYSLLIVAPDSPIFISDAKYGTTTTSCNAISTISTKCNTYSSCQVLSSNLLCGDPIPGTAKMLMVNYTCGTARYYFTDDEGDSRTLTCTPYTLTLNKSGAGTVSEIPDRGAIIWNGASGSAGFNSGTSVTLTATPDPGGVFIGWAGACTGTGTCTVTMDAAKSVTAAFTANQTITVTTVPAGLSVTVDGTAYTAPQSFSWASGSNHTIATTSPQNGGVGTQYLFGSWSDGGALAHTVAPAAPTTYTANLTTNYTLSTTITGNGSVNSGDIACTASPQAGTCAYSYSSGSTVTLQAAVSNSLFSGWGTDCLPCGNTSSCQVTMDSPANCSATFTDSSPITVSGSIQSFTLLQTAYAAAGTGATIKAQAMTFNENLVLDVAGRSVTVKGGYDPGFAKQSGITTLQGKLIIARGALLVDRMVIR